MLNRNRRLTVMLDVVELDRMNGCSEAVVTNRPQDNHQFE